MTTRTQIVAAYRTHGSVARAAAALHISRPIVSAALHAAGILRPRAAAGQPWRQTCPRCGKERKVNPSRDSVAECGGCRGDDGTHITPADITWSTGSLVRRPLYVYDPEPDTTIHRERVA